jgi:hypothetical protein
MICGLDIRVTCSVQHALALDWKHDNVRRVYSIVLRNISALVLSEHGATVRYGLFSQAAQTNNNNLPRISLQYNDTTCRKFRICTDEN